MTAFIIGCPRSGTYLLCTLIDSHLPVAVPVEPQFIPIFRPFLPLWGDLKVQVNREKLLTAVFGFLRIWTPRSERGKDWTKVKAHSLLAVEDELPSIVSSPVARSGTYVGLVEALFSSFAKAKGKKLAIDKSGFYGFVSPEKLRDENSTTRFIHIVRDGRDVALSWMKSWFGPTTLAEAAREWKRHVVEGRQWGKGNSDQYLEIRYEDLIADPDTHLGQIAKFLKVDFAVFNATLHMNSPMVAALQGEGGDHVLISGGMKASNQGKWREKMSKSDLRLFEFIAGDALRDFGYSLSDSAQPRGVEKLIFSMQIVRSYGIAAFSVRQWKRTIKKFLPLVLFMWRPVRK